MAGSDPAPPVPGTGSLATDPIGVIDLGSNSARVVVLRASANGHLEVLADSRAPSRLTLDTMDGLLSKASIERVVGVVHDFAAVAEGSGAVSVRAVATAAVRDAANGKELVERVQRETGVDIRIIGGEEEARLAAVGAVAGLPVETAAVLDIGGGSLELTRVRDRQAHRSWTFPLGALRLSSEHLTSDPPTASELHRLSERVRDAVLAEGVSRLDRDERLAGTGGTIRNLAKIDRQTKGYPISRLHGYTLSRKRVEAVAALVSGRRQSRRRAISGLNPDRADSIVGGAHTVLVMMDMLDAEDLMVSGMGLREGIALSSLSLEPQPLPQIRRASVAALSGRFGTWDEGRAWRRVALMDLLSDALLPDASGKARERMRHAATLLDIGRSVDYYRRHEHTADIVLTADLDGFTHRALALLAAVIARSGEPGVRIQRYRPLVGSQDRETVTREATLLELADEVEHRLGPGDLARVRCDDRGRIVALTAPVFDPWKSERLGARFRKSFRKKLEITTPTDSISQGSE